MGNLIEFNENGLKFGINEWSECFKLASIDSLIKNYLIKQSSSYSRTDLIDVSTDVCTDGLTGVSTEVLTDVSTDVLTDNLTDNLKNDNSLTDTSLNRNLSTNCSIDEQKITKDFLRNEDKIKRFQIDNLVNFSKTKQTDNCSSNLINLSIKSDKQIDLISQYWNYTIEICKRDELISTKFNSHTYDEIENNCLDFIFFFFKLLNLEQFKRIKNKIEFCELIIKPRLIELFKLIEFDRCNSRKYLVL